MGEITFKAKRIDNGEWIEGFYTELPKPSLGATIINNGELCAEDISYYIIKNICKQSSNFSNAYPLEVVECEQYEIDPSTVCQFTGLTDKDGRRIFEGDIISFSHSKLAEGQDERDFMPYYEEYTRNYAVEFVNTYCTYGLRARNKSIHFRLSQATINTHNTKVIGNIYDNSELLKEDTQNANPAN